jgi:hypothetical protein
MLNEMDYYPPTREYEYNLVIRELVVHGDRGMMPWSVSSNYSLHVTVSI